jgi:hypothetical protein
VSRRVDLRWRQQHGLRWSPAVEHAASVWGRGRVAISFSGGGELGFIGFIAAHIANCDKCEQRWVSGDRPVDHLEYALKRSSARDIWQVAIGSEHKNAPATVKVRGRGRYEGAT